MNDSKTPPLIVNCHGGPTFSCPKRIDLETQFWTSRGFGYLDVDYSGSDGYGREYRQRILGKWGVQDVNDIITCVEYLISKKLIDATKIMIRGNSAGGFTALRAAAFSHYFKAVTSYYV
ncbi:MAG: prolyl oligopeptidase family serine peptidase [Rickettsia hoogstraalii]